MGDTRDPGELLALADALAQQAPSDLTSLTRPALKDIERDLSEAIAGWLRLSLQSA